MSGTAADRRSSLQQVDTHHDPNRRGDRWSPLFWAPCFHCGSTPLNRLSAIDYRHGATDSTSLKTALLWSSTRTKSVSSVTIPNISPLQNCSRLAEHTSHRDAAHRGELLTQILRETVAGDHPFPLSDPRDVVRRTKRGMMSEAKSSRLSLSSLRQVDAPTTPRYRNSSPLNKRRWFGVEKWWRPDGNIYCRHRLEVGRRR
jgi:hypothetical protein